MITSYSRNGIIYNPTTKEPPVNGFFFKIKDKENKTRGYLLGTVHYGDYYVQQLNAKIHKAFDKSSLYAKEVGSKAGLEKFSERLKALTQDEISNYQIWQLVRERAFCFLDKMIDKGVEHLLDVKAANNKKPIVDIDDVDLNVKLIRYMASKNDINFDKMMQKDKEELEKFDNKAKAMAKHFEELMQAWKKGDDACFHRPELANYELNAERNIYMAGKINQFLTCSQKRCFFTFGAAHLFTDIGVLELLKQKGWMLKRVNAF